VGNGTKLITQSPARVVLFRGISSRNSIKQRSRKRCFIGPIRHPIFDEQPLRNQKSASVIMSPPPNFVNGSVRMSTTHAPKMHVYYAVVEHDFIAERQDELDARRGDAIVVVAQSNREWFVAKPIGKLGRPGLIPVSFVQIHDPVTKKPVDDVDALIEKGEIPKVEDWKLAMISYKQNSISLGVLDSPTSTPASPYTPSSEPNVIVEEPTPIEPIVPESLPDGRLLSANVVSFHYEMDEYWFRVDAIFQPYGRSDENLFPAKRLILFRAYNDFYEFQVSLLDAFPREAGRQPPQPRILPYMPGPSDDVNDALTVSRRKELDQYITDLCDLSKAGYQYILEHVVVRRFLALKPGDVEKDIEPESRRDETGALPQSHHQEHGYERVLQDKFSQLQVHQNSSTRTRSDGSEYEDESYLPSLQQRAIERNQSSADRERRPSQDSVTQLYGSSQGSHQRAGSAGSFYRASSPYHHSRSRSTSPQPYDAQWNDSTYQSNHATVQHPHQHHNFTHGPTASVSSRRSSNTTSSRSRSQSTAPTNINSPPISAVNPQTAFVKIKIFDKTSDDLIAIRVHPRVTHAELMKKVQARLENVNCLGYKSSKANSFINLTSDKDLGDWMESTDKHVLYAE
jgi:bud emergence protein 1